MIDLKDKQNRFLVLTGNYGSGKTEIAINLAFSANEHEKVTLVDLDIVNPYFRSGEKAEQLRQAGVRVLMPVFALTTVDIPALPPEIQSVFEQPYDRIIFDVGGDDTGAAALGRYYPSFMAHREETCMALVVNCMRPLTRTAEDIIDLAARISNRGRLPISILINNTNLAGQTTPEMLEEGERTVSECAERLGVHSVINAGMPHILAKSYLIHPQMPVCRTMVPEWMEDE